VCAINWIDLKGATAMNKKRLLFCMIATLALVFLSVPCWSSPQMDAAKKWVDNEFQPSTLTKDQQMKEMEWFIKASKPFKGMKIKVVSETIPTHEKWTACWCCWLCYCTWY
jgi:glycerol transport system substrate-binding protein